MKAWTRTPPDLDVIWVPPMWLVVWWHVRKLGACRDCTPEGK